MPLIHVEDNVEIYYEEFGSGDEAVICTQCDHGKYSLEMELAKRGFHVYLLTNRGFGRSTHVTEDYGDYWYDVFARDVIAFADAMGIEKFIYSGASHGAGAGWHVVIKYQERVKCFFAVVPGPHNIDESKMSFRTMGMLGVQPVKPVFRYPCGDERVVERWKDEDAWKNKRMREPDYDMIYNSPETKAIDYGRPLRSYKTEANVVEELKKIQIPVLIIGGMEDNISRIDLMVRSAQCIPHCKLVVHSGFGHDLAIWEEVADDCVRFFENIKHTGYYYSSVVNCLESD